MVHELLLLLLLLLFIIIIVINTINLCFSLKQFLVIHTTDHIKL